MWLHLNDSSLTQFIRLSQCASETIFREGAGFLPIVISEWVLYRRVLCSQRVPWMLQHYFVPNHLCENSLLASFHHTNASFTCLNPISFHLFCLPWGLENKRTAFLRIEEFSCEDLTLSTSSSSSSSCPPTALLSITAFLQRGKLSRKNLTNRGWKERWKIHLKKIFYVYFCICCLLLWLKLISIAKGPCPERPWQCLLLLCIPLPPSVVRTSSAKDVPMKKGQKQKPE